MSPDTSGPPLDGIAPPTAQVSPEPTPASSSLPPTERPAHGSTKKLWILYGVFAVLYILPALVFMGMFPTPDGSLESLKQGVTAAYSLGSLLWLGFLVLGLLRVSGVKTSRRIRMIAMMRLLIAAMPPLLIGAGLLLLINTSPKLRLEVTAPVSADAFVAPLSVSFGMTDALAYFRQHQLTPLKYQWDYNNDGVVDQETFDPQSTYLIGKAGIYSIVCTVTMTNGEKKTLTYRLVIPRASFAVQPLVPIVDEQVTFSLENLFPKTTDTTAPKLQKAQWDFDGDGTIDLETDKLVAAYTYHRLGQVKVAVSMTLSNQSQSSLQRVIEVTKAPEQPFPITLQTEPQTLIGPPPFGVLFTLKTDEPIAAANWDFGNQKSAEGLRVAQVFSAIGAYNVTATVRSQSGAVAKLTKLVRVTNPLEIRDLSFEGDPQVKNFTVEGQVPLEIKLTPVTSQPLISFTWDAPRAQESEVTENTLHAIFRDEGRYSVDLIGVDPEQNVFRKTISVTALPPKSSVAFSMDPATPTAPALVKFDASDTFVPAGDEITGFEWNFGDSLSGGDRTKFSGARIEHLYQRPGTYVIELTVRTVSGKSYVGRQTLLVRAPLFDACFVPSRTSGKAPLGVRFDTSCSTGDFNTWLWDFDDGAQSDQQNPTHVFLESGEYAVTLTATTRDGQKGSKTVTISVSP